MKYSIAPYTKENMKVSDLDAFKGIKQYLKEDEYTPEKYARMAMNHRLDKYLSPDDILMAKATIYQADWHRGTSRYISDDKGFGVWIDCIVRVWGEGFYTATFELADICAITYGEKQEGIMSADVEHYVKDKI